MRQTSKTRRTIGIRGQLMGFLCFICLLLVGLFWFLSIAGVVLLIKALLDKPTRWENFMPAVVAFALSLLIGWIF